MQVQAEFLKCGKALWKDGSDGESAYGSHVKNHSRYDNAYMTKEVTGV